MNSKIALVASALALGGAVYGSTSCGGDECSLAEDHLSDCDATTTSQDSTSGGGAMLACSGENLCNSKCINLHTCEQIKAQAASYVECMDACAQGVR